MSASFCDMLLKRCTAHAGVAGNKSEPAAVTFSGITATQEIHKTSELMVCSRQDKGEFPVLVQLLRHVNETWKCIFGPVM